MNKVDAMLEVLANNAIDNGWEGYAQFLLHKKQGLRKPAMRALEEFITLLSKSDLSTRVNFVKWVMPEDEAVGEVTLVPINLWSKIIEPTLSDWPEDTAPSIDPLVWLGSDESLELAVQKEPGSEKAIARYYARITGRIEMNQHETDKFGYDGDPEQDAEILSRLRDVCANSAIKLDYEKQIAKLMKTAEEWSYRKQERKNNNKFT